MNIQILDEGTVNKIAAGEVIERPASALKELLENSADSHATSVEIDFEAGGKKLLRVRDNGSGMAADELPLALTRHATSKIRTIDDLSSLYTFGFRGEALSSMAAVSELTIHSGLKDAKVGAKILADGGKIHPPEPAAPVSGTETVLRNIFFNVPARQKFLKSDAGETAAVKKVVRAFALSHPKIAITLRQNGKALDSWPKQAFHQRACQTLGLKSSDALEVVEEFDGFKIEATIGLPETNLATQQGIWIFVQGRPVNDRMITQAIIEGYRNLVMSHQYPQVVLKLWVKPDVVDVNVHPAKSQVKFAQPSMIFRFVSSTIKRVLEANIKKSWESDASEPASYLEPAPDFQPELIRDAVTQYNQRILEKPATQTSSVEMSSTNVGGWSSLQLIGQLANTYIVTQTPKALVLVDQHAAHERVLFERLKLTAKEKIEKQASLFEEPIEMVPEAIEALTDERFAEFFDNVGFEITARGPTVLGVQARPAFLADIGLRPLFERVAEQIMDLGETTVLDDLYTDLWASMACHGAIRAGRVLSRNEMQALLVQMDEFSFSSFCPHGRPVSVQFGLHELEKMFKRIV